MAMHISGAFADQPAIATLRIADWLCLAAAPAFAIMAAFTGMAESGSNDILCSTAHSASPLGGMASMYALMSVFHAAPWLKLIFR